MTVNLSHNLLTRWAKSRAIWIFKCYTKFSLPPNFPLLSHITKLDLSKNGLTELPENFGSFKALKSLDLYANRWRLCWKTVLTSDLTTLRTGLRSCQWALRSWSTWSGWTWRTTRCAPHSSRRRATASHLTIVLFVPKRCFKATFSFFCQKQQ